MYLLNQIIVVATAPDYMPKKWGFFLKKRMKETFAYVLECMLTFGKMQNTSPLMCTKFKIWRQSVLKVIQAFHTVRIFLYIGCSGPVVECLNKINMLQSTTRPLGHCYVSWKSISFSSASDLHVYKEHAHTRYPLACCYWDMIAGEFTWLYHDSPSSPRSFEFFEKHVLKEFMKDWYRINII